MTSFLSFDADASNVGARSGYHALLDAVLGQLLTGVRAGLADLSGAATSTAQGAAARELAAVPGVPAY